MAKTKLPKGYAKDKRFHFRIKENDYNNFIYYCKSNNFNTSKILRCIILEFLETKKEFIKQNK